MSAQIRMGTYTLAMHMLGKAVMSTRIRMGRTHGALVYGDQRGVGKHGWLVGA